MGPLSGRSSRNGTRVDLQFGFDATPLKVRATLEALDRQLTAHGLADTARGDIQLTLAEVLNNVVEHAYSGRSVGSIDLSVTVRAKSVALRVVDSGATLPDGHLPEGTIPDVDVAIADLPEGGFGWAILRSLASDIRYERARGRNILEFAVPTGGNDR